MLAQDLGDRKVVRILRATFRAGAPYNARYIVEITYSYNIVNSAQTSQKTRFRETSKQSNITSHTISTKVLIKRVMFIIQCWLIGYQQASNA